MGRQGGTGFQREAGRTAHSGPAQTRRALGRVPQRSPPRAACAPMPLCVQIQGAKDSGCEGWSLGAVKNEQILAQIFKNRIPSLRERVVRQPMKCDLKECLDASAAVNACGLNQCPNRTVFRANKFWQNHRNRTGLFCQNHFARTGEVLQNSGCGVLARFCGVLSGTFSGIWVLCGKFATF